MIEVLWAEGPPLLPDERVARAAGAALELGGRPGLALSVVFVGESALARLHESSLGDPEPTDVLAFDLGEEGSGPAGEIYVDVDRARTVAGELGARTERELLLYVVHGALHLCGFDDRGEAEAVRMRAAERTVLVRIGQAPDPERHGSA